MTVQRTIAQKVVLEGIGLHTGNMTTMTFLPAPENTGVRFVRVDLKDKPVIVANASNVSSAVRGTTIGDPAIAQVHTIEHILAVFSALGIDNIEVQLTNNEPPILDGSARPFAQAVLKAGFTEQKAEREYFVVTEPIIYEAETTRFELNPSTGFEIDCTVIYKHPFLNQQQRHMLVTEESFMNDLVAARTFCFDYEIEAIKRRGLGKGGDFSNAIIVGINGVHNPDAQLRYPDEFVRHKMLDLIGDLFLLGKRIQGKIIAVRPGHYHNIKYVQQIYHVMEKNKLKEQ